VADHLTDEEQLQQLKNWWKENGTALIIAVLVGLITYFSYQWWQNYQQQQAEQASAIYTQFTEVLSIDGAEPITDESVSTAQYLLKQLQEDYTSSQYAANASLMMAKLAVDKGDLEGAETALLWSIDEGADSLKALAKFRLARVYLSQKKYDSVLPLVDDPEETSFLSLNAELKGDVYAAREEWQLAREAYQQAINTLGESASFRRRLLPIKLANLPSGDNK
jgi:predicted negative regulator of RcsB-dependent stress response